MDCKPYKERTKSQELLCMESLSQRMILAEKDQQHYISLKKGFQGEVMFDSLTKELNCECLILNDLLLQVNNTTFQIDTLIIFPQLVYLYEVKSFEGDYYFEGGQFFKRMPKVEYSNPLQQIERSESLLRQLLNYLGYQPAIESSVIFINPEFSLLQAPLDKPIILPTQILRYLKKLDSSSSRLNGKHKILADKLVALHLEKSPYSQVPSYDYAQLKKGITCVNCHSFTIFVEGKRCVCNDCKTEEAVSLAVLRHVRELKLLFPEKKITTRIVHEWCGGIVSKRWIRSILQKNFKMIGIHQWAYYE